MSHEQRLAEQEALRMRIRLEVRRAFVELRARIIERCDFDPGVLEAMNEGPGAKPFEKMLVEEIVEKGPRYP